MSLPSKRWVINELYKRGIKEGDPIQSATYTSFIRTNLWKWGDLKRVNTNNSIHNGYYILSDNPLYRVFLYTKRNVRVTVTSPLHEFCTKLA